MTAAVLSISVGIVGVPLIAMGDDCTPATAAATSSEPADGATDSAIDVDGAAMDAGGSGDPVCPTTPPDTPTAPPGDPTAPPTDEPTTPPTDDPTAPPTDDPTAPPTDEPTPPPTDEPTAPPTDDPTAQPTETPTPTPTPTPTTTPRTPPDDAVHQVPTRRPVKVPPASQFFSRYRAGALVGAKDQLTEAQKEYEQAQSEYAAARAQQASAEALASQLTDMADQADARAALARQALLKFAKATAGYPTPSTLDVVFGNGDLLRGLAQLDRLERIAGDPGKLAAQAESDAAQAERLREKAASASADADSIQLSELAGAVDSADEAVETATAALQQVQLDLTGTAASDLTGAVDAGRLSDAGWIAPVRGEITDGFGPRPSQPAGAGPFHYGVDLGAACGTWILAARGGTVVDAGWFGTLGNWVLIDHGDGVETAYAHIAMGGTVVSVGDTVAAGEPIGLVGSTGASTGCHLHLEVRIDGVRTDPVPFFAARGVLLGE